ALPHPSTLGSPALREQIMQFLDQTKASLQDESIEGEIDPNDRLDEMQHQYRALKAEVLAEGARGEFDVHDMELCLRRLSRMRRLAEQALKAAATLRTLNLSPDQTVIQNDPTPNPPAA
ncbi:MAG TPA: hypothetical protein VLM84_07725, partial [Chromatiaceae bacterium]|nr:hypothetical protein [Chromatiaceae bacterium]